MKPKIGDYVLIFAVIIISAVIIFPKKAAGNTAVIYCDGEKLATLSLANDCEFAVDSTYNNIVVIKDGQAYVSSADCPDKVCVKSGKILKSGQMICCLPNKMIVKIESVNAKTDVIAK